MANVEGADTVRTSGRMRTFAGRASSFIQVVLSFGTLVVLWQVGSMLINIPVLFPSPASVGERAVEMLAVGELQGHIAISVFRIATGFLIGVILAVPLGLVMGNVPLVQRLVDPWVEFFRYIPALALTTMALIWFGSGESSKVFLIVYGTVFIVTVNTVVGVKAIPRNRIRAARSLGASPGQAFLHASLPSTLPFVFTGMRVALGNAFATIVAAELVASRSGLGFVIFNSRLFLDTEAIFVAIISLGLLGFTGDRLLRLAFATVGARYVRAT